LGELARTAIILSFGELLSSYIIAAALKQKIAANSDYKDSRDLIKQTIILVMLQILI
jgi:aspartokinase/homoserine dehydrogenase 1